MQYKIMNLVCKKSRDLDLRSGNPDRLSGKKPEINVPGLKDYTAAHEFTLSPLTLTGLTLKKQATMHQVRWRPTAITPTFTSDPACGYV
jgi:hypothetical protein